MTDSIRAQNVTVRYGAFTALREVSLELPKGVITGVIGPNGAGKTTLLNALSGFTAVHSGTIHLEDRDITDLPAYRRARLGVIRGFQTVRLLERESVLDNVLLGTERLPQPGDISQLLALRAQWRWKKSAREEAREVLQLLGLSSESERIVDSLPFASRRLVEVARVLVSAPPLVLLDEPAAGLDQRGRLELATALARVHQQSGFTLAVVEHDIDFVTKLCTNVIAMDSGKFIMAGTPEEVFADPRVQTSYFGRSTHAQA